MTCSHLAADLNFSRYCERRLSCPGRSIRVQVVAWVQEGKRKSVNHDHHERMITDDKLNSPCHFWLCMERCCQWWRSVSVCTFLTTAAKTWNRRSLTTHISLASAKHPLLDNVAVYNTLQLHGLTRLKMRVFPESHSPTSSTALLTVLLVRKYFRNTEIDSNVWLKHPVVH